MTEVVIVEGFIDGHNREVQVLDAYNAEYDWDNTRPRKPGSVAGVRRI